MHWVPDDFQVGFCLKNQTSHSVKQCIRKSPLIQMAPARVTQLFLSVSDLGLNQKLQGQSENSKETDEQCQVVSAYEKGH